MREVRETLRGGATAHDHGALSTSSRRTQATGARGPYRGRQHEHIPLAFVACAPRGRRGERLELREAEVLPAERWSIRDLGGTFGEELPTDLLHELSVRRFAGSRAFAEELAHARRVLRCQ